METITAMITARITNPPIFCPTVTPGSETPQLGQVFAEVSTLCLQDLQGFNAIRITPFVFHKKPAIVAGVLHPII
jgi:hypothetical protein